MRVQLHSFLNSPIHEGECPASGRTCLAPFRWLGTKWMVVGAQNVMKVVQNRKKCLPRPRVESPFLGHPTYSPATVLVYLSCLIIIISSSSSGKSRPNVCGIEPRIAYRGSKWDGRRWALCWQGTCRCHVPTTRGFPAFQLSSGFYRRMYTRQISISGINYDMLGKECFRNEYNQM